MLEDILLQVRKPSRYLGNEWNAVKKDFHKQEVKFAICFPDLYEAGMSHLGLRIIYGLLNSQEGVVCERVFLPDLDMQEILKSQKMPLFSLESRAPLKDFDFIGFCLNYELDYTNVLAILDLAGIPLLAKDRTAAHPIIIAGGCCTVNPEPMADFIDVFLIGEAEEALVEIVSVYKSINSTSLRGAVVDLGRRSNPVLKNGIASSQTCQVKVPRNDTFREDALKSLAKIEGVYVPSFYDVEYKDDGLIESFVPKYPDAPVQIKRRIVENLDAAYYPWQWMVPYIQIIHDRAAVEVMRGCPHSCAFCLAKAFYQKPRIRSKEKVLQIIDQITKSSGYEEISLFSLSTSDYPYLVDVVASVSKKFEEQAIGISLPSLRPKAYLGDVAQYLAKVRKSTLTFAPETGSDRLRDFIHKDFDLEELYAAVSNAYKNGWQSVKLYFMLGLPSETDEDLDGIIEIAKKVSSLRKAVAGFPAEVTLSISFFIPKPHTSFQREPMAAAYSLFKKREYLRNMAKSLPRRIKLNFHNLETCLLEAAFSRGDRSLGKVLLSAYQSGCLLDSWPEHFDFQKWKGAFEKNNVLLQFYARQRSPDEILPWQHIIM